MYMTLRYASTRLTCLYVTDNNIALCMKGQYYFSHVGASVPVYLLTVWKTLTSLSNEYTAKTKFVGLTMMYVM